MSGLTGEVACIKFMLTKRGEGEGELGRRCCDFALLSNDAASEGAPECCRPPLPLHFKLHTICTSSSVVDIPPSKRLERYWDNVTPGRPKELQKTLSFTHTTPSTQVLVRHTPPRHTPAPSTRLDVAE